MNHEIEHEMELPTSLYSGELILNLQFLDLLPSGYGIGIEFDVGWQCCIGWQFFEGFLDKHVDKG